MNGNDYRRSLAGWHDAGGRLKFPPFSSVKPVAVEYLLEGWVPLSAVTILAGTPGLGKSTLALDMAARVSRGQAEGALRGRPARVVLATAEDDYASVVVPRLLAAGADTGKVHYAAPSNDEEMNEGLMLPFDLGELKAFVQTDQAKLVVIDPLVAHLSPSVNSHRDQDVRLALAPLHRFAAEVQCAVLVIVHTNKSTAGELLHRVSGSVGIVGAARSVAFLAADPEDPDGPTRVLFHGKNNVGPTSLPQRLRVEYREVTGENGLPIGTSGIAHLGEATGFSREHLLAGAIHTGSGALQDAEEWLREMLAEGAVLVKVLREEANAAGLGWRTIERAKEKLGVRAEKAGFQGPWVWRMPKDKGRHLALVGGLGAAPAGKDEAVANDRQDGELGGDGTGEEASQPSLQLSLEPPSQETVSDPVEADRLDDDGPPREDEHRALGPLEAEVRAIESATIDYICQRHREGADFSRITNELNAEGFPPPEGMDRWELGLVVQAYGRRHP